MKSLTPYDKNLRKIFRFYSNQQSLIGKSPTFDQIYQNANTLTKGKFLKFCLDFQIPLSHEAFLHIFNKSCKFNKEMNYEQFYYALELLMGKVPVKDFIKFLGIHRSKICISKCKPFSLANGASLPELPALVTPRKKVIVKKVLEKKEKLTEFKASGSNTNSTSRYNSVLNSRDEGVSRLARRFSLCNRADSDYF